jgi:hypothetical protein
MAHKVIMEMLQTERLIEAVVVVVHKAERLEMAVQAL